MRRPVVVCFSLFTCCWLFSARPLAAEGAPVMVSAVKEQPIQRQVEMTGSITSPRVAELSPSTSGLVEKLLADEGDRVSAGAELLQLDSELAELRWQSAKAQRQQAETALADARRRLAEARRLGPQRGIAETEVRGLEAEVASDQAALEQARADAAYQQALLQRHRLRAPFAGVVSRRLVEQGEWIEPGDGAFELVATDGLRLDFAVAEDYLADLRKDSTVQFRSNALPGETFKGQLHTIVPVTDPGARTFLLRVLPVEADSRLMPGMSVIATLQIPTQRRGLVVPRDAVLRQPSGRVVVWLIEAGETGLVAREQPVQVGQRGAGLVEVVGGLEPGARVVVRGNEALQNGQPVRIVDAGQRGQ